MLTMQDVQDVMGKWEQTKERAEQHDFPFILFWDMRIAPLYEDLKVNWTEEHARKLINGVNLIVQKLGYV